MGKGEGDVSEEKSLEVIQNLGSVFWWQKNTTLRLAKEFIAVSRNPVVEPVSWSAWKELEDCEQRPS